MFFSGNAYYTSHYAIGYAVCASPLGPCVQPQDKPLYASTGAVAGPGGQEFFRDRNGQPIMCYAAWTAGDIGPKGTRSLRFDSISFHDGVPTIDGPTLGTTVISPHH
ncbi:MAG: hypothetical protein J2P57_01765 [Acidimicrobiaceae bacterium]|nr:hypothetical protein [Acidimicrobiaceae bacterium]